VPFPGSLVVKKGSKMRDCSSGSIPTPVSLSVSATYAPGRTPAGRSGVSGRKIRLAVVTVMRPPSGIASRAFTTRLITTCSSCPGSASTYQSPGSAWVSTTTPAPARRRTMPSSSVSTLLSESTLGCSTWRRLKASSWRVRPAARWPAWRICSTSPRMGSPLRTSSRRRSQ
jgi:hypothetical protein